MFWLFTNKKKVDKVREETRKGFESVKKDMSSISDWIKHLDSEKNTHKKEIEEIKSFLSSIKDEIREIKNDVQVMNTINPTQSFKQPFKTDNQMFNKQTPVQTIQTPNQTAVQTPNLSLFSITERAIIGILLNTDMKLSYEDIAAMLGKGKSTIRGQINTIKAKSESLIQEKIEKNGKKRVFIPQKTKEKLLKKQKVRVNNKEKDE